MKIANTLLDFKAKVLNELWYWRLNKKYVVVNEGFSFGFTLACLPALMRPNIPQIKVDRCIYVHVPYGFVTDLASVPKGLQWLFKPDGKWARAAAVHDFLYGAKKRQLGYGTGPESGLEGLVEGKLANRAVADAVFYVALRQSKVGFFTSSLFYSAVRVAGWMFYLKHDRCECAHMITQAGKSYDRAEGAGEVPVYSLSSKFEDFTPTFEADVTVQPVYNLQTPLFLH